MVAYDKVKYDWRDPEVAVDNRPRDEACLTCRYFWASRLPDTAPGEGYSWSGPPVIECRLNPVAVETAVARWCGHWAPRRPPPDTRL